MSGLLLPVGPRRMSSWAAHQKRSPRSTEPGTDFYCPIGTPVLAPGDGWVYGYGTSIVPATGKWVGLDLKNGMRFRAMHFSRIALSDSVLRNRGFVKRGQVIGYSGATGYGENDWSWNPNTGGAHTHVTLWPTWSSKYGYDSSGKPYTVDFMKYAENPGPAGSGGVESEEDDMFDDADRKLLKEVLTEIRNTKAGVWTGGVSGGKKFNYGILPIVAHNQTLIAQQSGRIAAIEEVVEQIAKGSGSSLDMKAVEEAARRGSQAALSDLVLRAD